LLAHFPASFQGPTQARNNQWAHSAISELPIDYEFPYARFHSQLNQYVELNSRKAGPVMNLIVFWIRKLENNDNASAFQVNSRFHRYDCKTPSEADPQKITEGNNSRKTDSNATKESSEKKERELAKEIT
jgi:hypothetical protein